MNETTFTINKEELTVTIERVFDAPKELVWRATTDPELIPKWWGPEKYPITVDQMDVKVGGKWRFVGKNPDGSEFAFGGDYLEIDEPNRIVQTFNFEPIGPGHESTETATFESAEGNKTKMKAVSVYKSIDDLDGTINSGMEGGARETWERLAKLVGTL